MALRTLGTLVLLFVCATAAGWWNEEWLGRKQVTIEPVDAGISTALADVPVLVRLHVGNFPQFLNVRDGAADFRFVAADDLQGLRYHIESFDPVGEMAFAWVRQPQITPAAGANSFWLYFGNAEAPAAQNAGETFDPATVAAFHFSETGGLPKDSSAFNTPVLSGDVIPNPASLIGRGISLPGTGAMILAQTPQLALDPARGWTFSTWVRLNQPPQDTAALLSWAGGGNALSVDVSSSSIQASFNDSVASGPPIADGQWHHVSLVVTAAELALFVDGEQVAATAVSVAAISGSIAIGGTAANERLLVADLDELEIANAGRSAQWLKFAYIQQGLRHDQITHYGLDETAEGGAAGHSQGHFAIIFQSVFGNKDAIVEQLVIGVCGLMMAAAIAIMFLKAYSLQRAAKASEKFLQAFGSVSMTDDVAGGHSGQGATLDDLYLANTAFGESPLWKVFHAGIDEVRKRTQSKANAEGLDSKAMASVRAALDAVMVREGQRLTSQLVLLTIAISGGPFIGLLGTVVGVMVTFAAIAATGDVNIAAIAPGMAAALLATVAGLGVAIPSLFGYNYLSSRAKELSADMHVFADEITARFNELYGA
ncbi:MAG: DUF2341 domain-containing protein [Gammaproteobacteria bacterium]|nr:DUF2341 domain-containing protein [Gammaproteobacteria bacterium]